MANPVNGDIGHKWLRTLVDQDGVDVDISGATTLQFILKDPVGTVTTKTASLTSGGTDGKVEYTSVSGDIDQVGGWEFQFRLADSGPLTYDFRTVREKFTVSEEIT